MQVSLHAGQAEVYHDTARFKVVAAGRRWGKSYMAAVTLFVEAARNYKVRSDGVTIDLALEEVYYVAPTFEQGKKILWPLLKEVGHELIDQKYENTGTLTLKNGRRISIKGADRPDSLRGVGLSYVVMDEYAFMKEEVWEMIISPALARAEGGALFIGTPDGKNHFYHLWHYALTSGDPEWKAWHFKSIENPHLPAAEIDKARKRMSAERFLQEMEASFEGSGGLVLTREMFPFLDTEPEGLTYIAVDLAGFTKTEGGRKIKKLDEHAIAVVVNHKGGWWVKEIIHGQWDVRETALRIVRAVREHRPLAVGIERGMALNAVVPYLEDMQELHRTYFNIEELTHGNQRKQDRIEWALSGRADKGRIQLKKGAWNVPFFEQATGFPSPLIHDDLIDALAYIDQLVEPYVETGEIDVEDWEPEDAVAGY
ncbi:MAG: terminase family protein [Myxococcota bacterium]|nr:terminase family protein [Myxococcota bacterium]